MRPHNLRDLPKVRDSLSYLYLEYGRVEQTKLGVEFIDKKGSILIPAASLCTLMLGPGTVVTHAAVRSLARTGCLVIWCGQEGVRFYAQGLGETHKAYKLMRQAELSSSPEKRMQVVERMYRMRFREKLPRNLSIEQIRGKEGIRVRQAYAEAARYYEVEWRGRNYDRGNWADADPLNRALSAANACLNGIAHAAILSAGYSPGLGFIHQGKQLAFAYDIADLYKVMISVPVAFSIVAEEHPKLESAVRKRCRATFRNLKLLARIIPDIEKVLDIESDDLLPDGFDPDLDPALPTPWWEPSGDGANTPPEEASS